MRITKLDTVTVDFYRTNLIFLRVETDEGITGVAEATLEGQEFAVQGAIRLLEQAVVGKDPTRISQLVYETARNGYWRGGPGTGGPPGALEMGLWGISAPAPGGRESTR